MEGPWCRFREEREPVSDIDTAVVDSLKARPHLKRPIREADIAEGPSCAISGLLHRSKHQAGPFPRSVSCTCLSSAFLQIYGINCRPKLGAKLLDRFFHRRRAGLPASPYPSPSPSISSIAISRCSRHSAVASSSIRQAAEHGRAIPLPIKPPRRSDTDKRTTRRATARRLPASSEGPR